MILYLRNRFAIEDREGKSDVVNAGTCEIRNDAISATHPFF
jgi:hypothetical protein